MNEKKKKLEHNENDRKKTQFNAQLVKLKSGIVNKK